MKSSPKNVFDLRMFLPLKQFFERIYFGEVLTPATEGEQLFFYEILEKLKSKKSIKDKDNVLKNAHNFYDGIEIIINAFKNRLLPLYSRNCYEEFKGELSEESSEGKNEEPPRDEYKEGKEDDRLPKIEEEEEPIEETEKEVSKQINELDKFYDRDLIYKFFF